jgi:2-isopropylmalate synthase
LINILDATLREGEQTPGVYFDGHIKLAIVDLLDEVGIDIIEAGHPIVTTDIRDAVRQVANRGLKAVVGAHSRSVEKDIDIALECGVGFLGIFYCVSDERLNNVFKKDLTTAIKQIVQSIQYAKNHKADLIVRYTPEDTVRSKFENVLMAASAAVEAGADIISIADTTGYMVPGTDHNMYDYTSRLRDELDRKSLHPTIALHCHNDRGLALANALDGYRAGARLIDASVLGLGERAGIVDLAQLIVTLMTEFNVKKNWNPEKLPALYELVSKYAGIPIPANLPVIGENAFTHCAGVHTHAAVENPVHYQSLDPALVGRKMKVSLDHMSGISSVKWALSKLGIELAHETEQQVLQVVKMIGQKGRVVDLTELEHIVEWCKKHPA